MVLAAWTRIANPRGVQQQHQTIMCTADLITSLHEQHGGVAMRIDKLNGTLDGDKGEDEKDVHGGTIGEG